MYPINICPSQIFNHRSPSLQEFQNPNEILEYTILRKSTTTAREGYCTPFPNESLTKLQLFYMGAKEALSRYAPFYLKKIKLELTQKESNFFGHNRRN